MSPVGPPRQILCRNKMSAYGANKPETTLMTPLRNSHSRFYRPLRLMPQHFKLRRGWFGHPLIWEGPDVVAICSRRASLSCQAGTQALRWALPVAEVVV